MRLAKALAERHGVGLALDLGGFRRYSQRLFLLDRLSVPEAHSEAAPVSGNPFARGVWRQRVNRLLDVAHLSKTG